MQIPSHLNLPKETAMKYRDYKALEDMFRDKPSKKSGESDIATFVKVYKKIKKFEELEKTHKKEDKKEEKDKKGVWHDMSTIQKVTILTAIVPVVFTLEFLVPLLIIIKGLGLHP